jgi:hypothetical protein
MKLNWNKKYTQWIEGRTLFVSIPFTWELSKVKWFVRQKSFLWDQVVVGGPAVMLMPDYFSDINYVSIGYKYEGVLQKVNPLATRTTIGCPNRCGFCAVPKIYGPLVELDDYPDLPVLCDDNLLAASIEHFDKVIDKLIVHGWANFNQGLDSRRLTDYHAMRIAEIKNPLVYLALDSMSYSDDWLCAYDRLRSAGLNKANIRSYALVAFDSDPSECLERCEFIESHNIKVLPMWFHRLDALKVNFVTPRQFKFGWSESKRLKFMGYYYQHRGAVAV